MVSFSYAHGVDITARIRGTVIDPTGAVVPNVAVTATNEQTGVIYRTASQANGDYQFLELPIGIYTVNATAPGFKSFTATGIKLSINQLYVEPVKLDLGSSAENISVAADQVQVDTTDMQLSNVVDASQMVAYPLIGRAFTSLELILPGVQAPSDRFGGNYSVNGAQTQQSSYLINGADTNDFALNTVGIEPNLDALGQFTVITSSLNAEYSRNSGAIVSTVVKSGTNSFHGDIFEFYRDTFLNNKNFFQKKAPIFHQNLYGGTFGGPIFKDKLFFFAGYQGEAARTPQGGGNVLVPTAAQRAGNFAGTTFSSNPIPSTIVIPGCAGKTYAQCFAAGSISTADFNPISAALLAKYVPAANSGTNHYFFNPISTLTQRQLVTRMDFNPTSKDQIYGVGIYQHFPRADTLPFFGSSLPGFGETSTSEIYQYTASYARQINATTLNEFLLHYTRFNLAFVTPQTVVLPSTAGFAINPQNAAAASLPHISIAGNFTLGFSANGPQPRVDQNYQADDNFSKIIGHHSLKFGYDGRRFGMDLEFFNSNNGSFGFSATKSNPNTSGSALLDFLLGVPSSYAQGAGGRTTVKSYESYFYGQDSWKATDALVINIGVGYQIDTPEYNGQYKNIGVNCFVPGQQSKVFPTAPLSLNFPGDPGCNNAQGGKTLYGDVGPRIGLAYSPDLGWLSDGNSHKLSIRAGYGIYYNRTESETALQNLGEAPFGVNSAGVADYVGGARPTFANPYEDINTGKSYTNKFPASFPQPGDTKINFDQFGALSVNQFSPDFRSPYQENFNLTVERELPGAIVATASYVGAVGRHNQITYEGNPITQAGHDACLANPVCVAKQDFQPTLYPSHTEFPQAIDPTLGQTHFNGVGLIATGGSSNYNSLELSAKKNDTHGLVFQISYTLSHSLDDSSSFENSGFGESGVRGYNRFDKALNYGNSAFDARQRLVIAPIYSVPYHSSGGPFSFRNLLGAGWQISTITTFASGQPYDISYAGGVSYSLYCGAAVGYYACPDVPNQTASLVRVNPNQHNGKYFSPASFTDEAVGTFGNISRNKYHGPGYDNTDAQLSKFFDLGAESARRLELRIESYNAFNHTNFFNPDGNYLDSNAGGTFGQITGANPGRQFQLVGKLYF